MKRGVYRRACAGSGGKHATRARSRCTRFRIYPPNDAPSRRFCLIGFFISAADDQIACGLANDKVAAFVLGAAEPLLPNNFTVWAEAHDKAVVMLGITQPLPAGSDVVAFTQPDDVGEDRDRKRRVVADASIDDDPAVGVFTPYHPDNAAGIGSIETTDRH